MEFLLRLLSQQSLHERAFMLRYTYIASLFAHFFDVQFPLFECNINQGKVTLLQFHLLAPTAELQSFQTKWSLVTDLRNPIKPTYL